MAHPSPSPSGSSSISRRRRLWEVLSEQQEPFSLDLYLLEKGCSPAFLDGGGGACSTCWPRTSSGGLALRRPGRSKKGSRGSGGVLRLLLSKVLRGMTASAAPPAAAKKKRQQPAAMDWRRADEKRRAPERALPYSPRRAADGQRVEEEEEDGEREDDDEEEEEEEASSSKKQLSPVSVLEQRLFEHSPPPPHAQKALAIFSELLEAAYTPTSLLDLLAHAKDYRSSSTNRSKDGALRTLLPRGRGRKKKDAHAHAHYWKEEDTALQKEIGRVRALVASEMCGARTSTAEVWAWAQDVGAAVADAVLDALTEETAAELMPDAAGEWGGWTRTTPRLCG